jgi:D-alanyl-lipoteichoic acid acyltransferase DltB (MBOAT superfamily)
MLVMGLWHAVDLNWLAWGLYHGTGLVILSRWERWKKARRKKRKKAGLPPAASYEKYTRWLGYPVTFLYVALGYGFVATPNFEQALRVLYNVFRLPLAWLFGVLF